MFAGIRDERHNHPVMVANKKCIYNDVKSPCDLCVSRGLSCTADDKNFGKSATNHMNHPSSIPGVGMMIFEPFPAVSTQGTFGSKTVFKSTAPSPSRTRKRRLPSSVHSLPEDSSPSLSLYHLDLKDDVPLDALRAIKNYEERQKQIREELFETLMSITREHDSEPRPHALSPWGFDLGAVRQRSVESGEQCIQCREKHLGVLIPWRFILIRV